jgi:hypothetical protein
MVWCGVYAVYGYLRRYYMTIVYTPVLRGYELPKLRNRPAAMHHVPFGMKRRCKTSALDVSELLMRRVLRIMDVHKQVRTPCRFH